jgi:hypothetical protein
MTHARRARTMQPLLTLAAGAAATLVLLIVHRPTAGGGLAKGTGSWTADDLVAAGLWWGAVVGSAWLAVTTVACVAALARGRTRSAHRIARFAPPIARHVLQAALVSTWALAPAAAYAAPPSAPITVHVDASGRLSSDTPRAETDPPVVRTPGTRHTTTTTTTGPTTTGPTTTSRAATIRRTTTTIAATPASTPTTAPSVSRPTRPPPAASGPTAPHAVPSPTPVAEPTRARVHVVVPGDNLWQIARVEIMRVSGSDHVDDAQVAPYWQRVIAANRSTLRSGDPSLIFAGEVVTLP